MKIEIIDSIGFSPEDKLKLAMSLIENRKPIDGSLNYGFETHGWFGFVYGNKLNNPIQVYQSNKRKSNKSPIIIVIEPHTTI